VDPGELVAASVGDGTVVPVVAGDVVAVETGDIVVAV